MFIAPHNAAESLFQHHTKNHAAEAAAEIEGNKRKCSKSAMSHTIHFPEKRLALNIYKPRTFVPRCQVGGIIYFMARSCRRGLRYLLLR